MTNFDFMTFLYRLLKPLEKHRIQKVSELIDGDNLKVLEIGCADGDFLFKNRKKWKDITGIDINSDRLLIAKGRNYGIPSSFINLDVGSNKMPFKKEQFDLVVSIATLQYVSGFDLLFKEIYRVLKDDGQFIFQVPNAAVSWNRFTFLIGIYPNTSYKINDWQDGVLHYFTYDNLAKIIRLFNFKIERVTCSGIFSQVRQIWPSFLGADLIFLCSKD